jgi:hypothetical protein
MERRYRVIANTHIALWLSHLIASRSKIFSAIRDQILPLITLGILKEFFQRDVFIAGTSLPCHVRGPASSSSCRHLVGQHLPYHDANSDLLMSRSFCLLAQQQSDLDAVYLEAFPSCRLLVCHWIPARSILLRPDRHIMSAWAGPPPPDCLSCLADCLAHPKTDGQLLSSCYLFIFSLLKYFTPPVLLLILLFIFIVCILFMINS